MEWMQGRQVVINRDPNQEKTYFEMSHGWAIADMANAISIGRYQRTVSECELLHPAPLYMSDR